MVLIKTCIGFWFIYTAIVIGGITLFYDEPAKEKFIFGAIIEAFFTFIIIGAYFLNK